MQDTAKTLAQIAEKELYSTQTSTFSYLDAGGEQTILEISTSRILLLGGFIDVSNLTTNGTFKFYYKVDGTNYQEINALANTITGGTTEAILIPFNGYAIVSDFKITYTEAGDEGGDIDIPIEINYKDIFV